MYLIEGSRADANHDHHQLHTNILLQAADRNEEGVTHPYSLPDLLPRPGHISTVMADDVECSGMSSGACIAVSIGLLLLMLVYGLLSFVAATVSNFARRRISGDPLEHWAKQSRIQRLPGLLYCLLAGPIFYGMLYLLFTKTTDLGWDFKDPTGVDANAMTAAIGIVVVTHGLSVGICHISILIKHALAERRARARPAQTSGDVELQEVVT